jgi:hypothetical protein
MRKLGAVKVRFTRADVERSESKVVQGDRVYQVQYEMEVGKLEATNFTHHTLLKF